jgi:hypothetical protein
VYPQAVPLQVELLLAGVAQDEHETPQLAVLEFETHAPPQLW